MWIWVNGGNIGHRLASYYRSLGSSEQVFQEVLCIYSRNPVHTVKNHSESAFKQIRYFVEIDGQLFSKEDSDDGFELESAAQGFADKYEGVVVKMTGIKDIDTGKYQWFR